MATAEANPLLQIQLQIPFDRIRPEHVEPAVGELILNGQAHLDAIANEARPRTFENTLLALDGATEGLDYAIGVVKHLESVATTPELRAAYNAVEPAVSAFYSGIPLQEPLWKALKEYDGTPEAKSLAGTRHRFLTKTMDSFRRHGAELDGAGKARLEEIEVALAQVTTKYSENVLDETNSFELVLTDPATLAGLPESAVAAARASAAQKGIEGWRFTLQAPSYLAVMTYLDDAAIRQQMYHAYATRCTGGKFDNRTNLERILELRNEKARLLGFRNFADLVLEDRMAHTGERAERFLLTLKEKTLTHFARENAELERFRRGLNPAESGPVSPWDVAYLAEKQRAALYDFDEEALRPYFPLERVVDGMFRIVERLYGVRVSEQPGFPGWDPAVRCYSIHEERDGAYFGSFYADWFPRENKRGGAWMDAFITGTPSAAGFEPHSGLICGNLTPPVADRPSLLTHREVETIFHEFGHLLHHLLSRVEVRSLCGTNVAWDFVELPSQIMENWCWEREALDLFARHYQTGEPIPEELFQKMKRARTFRAANAQMRQLGFGLLDLALHTRYSPERDGSIVAYARDFLQEFSPAELPGGYAMIASFTHLFGSPTGYGAGYYSYKWAEILDADAFTRFQSEGVFSRAAGASFRETILARGDSEDPAELYRKFMGRDPDVTALLVRAGLAAGAKAL
jgi:oligopeptidase A